MVTYIKVRTCLQHTPLAYANLIAFIYEYRLSVVKVADVLKYAPAYAYLVTGTLSSVTTLVTLTVRLDALVVKEPLLTKLPLIALDVGAEQFCNHR
jgi:hypothetical protein